MVPTGPLSIWGAYHGLLLVLEQGVRTIFPGRLPEAESPWRFRQIPMILGTFFMVCLGLVFFRANSVAAAFPLPLQYRKQCGWIALFPYDTYIGLP